MWNVAHITTRVFKSTNRRGLSSRLYDHLEHGYDILVPRRNTTAISVFCVVGLQNEEYS